MPISESTRVKKKPFPSSHGETRRQWSEAAPMCACEVWDLPDERTLLTPAQGSHAASRRDKHCCKPTAGFLECQCPWFEHVPGSKIQRLHQSHRWKWCPFIPGRDFAQTGDCFQTPLQEHKSRNLLSSSNSACFVGILYYWDGSMNETKPSLLRKMYPQKL